MNRPLLVEIIAYAPTAYYHCTHCEVAWQEAGMPQRVHQEQVESSLPSDLTQQYWEISNWVRNLINRFGERVMVQVIDAASPEGLIKSLRHRVRRYPAVILNGRQRFTENALASAGEEIDLLLGHPQAEKTV